MCDYLRWLLSILDPGGHLFEYGFHDFTIYQILLTEPFVVPESIPMDDNRATDGIELRFSYIKELNRNSPMGSGLIDPMDGAPCSMLEMLIALAKRIEDNLMYDPAQGDRSYLWMYEMMSNLGITSGLDLGVPINADYVHTVLMRFNTRTYEPDGTGGLFKITNPRIDMRKIELWQQAQFAINERGI